MTTSVYLTIELFEYPDTKDHGSQERNVPACQTTNRTVRQGVAAASRAPAGGLRANHGYAMAALLVAIGIMGILMTVAMPVWHQTMQREKEEELIFRGRQYARAIGLFQRKFAGAFPPSVDLLVQQKFLRKKYKDPMAEDGAFQLIPAGAMQAGQVGATLAGGSTPASGRSAFGLSTQGGTQGSAQLTTGLSGQTVAGGIVGVVSKSKDKSIKLYNGRDHYNEWLFVYSAASGRGVGPGGAGRGPGGRGGPQGPGQNPSGRGRNPFGPGQNPFGPGQNPFGPGQDRFGPGGGRGPGG